MVLVSLVGFWEWRSALLMALAIPITLLMTFGMMDVSESTCSRSRSRRSSLRLACWSMTGRRGRCHTARPFGGASSANCGLVRAHETGDGDPVRHVTNIVAYLPFLLLTGDTGKFLYSLPIVITVALGRFPAGIHDLHSAAWLLPSAAEIGEVPAREEKPWLWGRYWKVGRDLAPNRWRRVRFLFLLAGGWIGSTLKLQFFPKDLSHLAYINVACRKTHLLRRQCRRGKGRAHCS